jgi:anti-sigma factor RsiW
MNIFQHHFSFERLADYTEERLPLEEQARVEMHLAACRRCSSEVTKLQRLIACMRRDTAHVTPLSVVQRAIQLFAAENAQMFLASGLRNRIVAVVQFDSLNMAPAFGMRSARPDARQILYRAGPYEIDLRIELGSQAWVVSGQVFGEAAAQDRVILQGEESTSESNLNDLKEFVLPEVQKGTYTLVLALKNMDVLIDNVRVGS